MKVKTIILTATVAALTVTIAMSSDRSGAGTGLHESGERMILSPWRPR